ncbi:uncharacterized protein LOC122320660 [Drosophila ficusphila]|uniref:uncharacterized protein LOC122320660 n=1 Tax=Drosophila ficusphila TaxID=30025 RepID=UPI001C89129D|nr:uncharacterized protein LOC122320660 [Drosophila ficusphila]
MKRLLVVLCLIFLLPFLLAENPPVNFPAVNRGKAPRTVPQNPARVGSRTLDSLNGLG